jgi:hypothetical protein
MKKKIIIGISSYAGSDTTYILSEVARFVATRSRRKLKFYTLKKNTPYEIVQRILLHRITETWWRKIIRLLFNINEKEPVYIIKHIRTVHDLQFFKVQLEGHDFKPIGIEVPWEECFGNFQRKGLIAPDMNPEAWRKKDMELQFRNDILECMSAIGTRNDNIYLYQVGSECEQIGRIADMILLS